MIKTNKINNNNIVSRYLVFLIIYNIKKRNIKEGEVSKFFNYIYYFIKTNTYKNKIIILKIIQILYFCFYRFYIFMQIIFSNIKYPNLFIRRSLILA